MSDTITSLADNLQRLVDVTDAIGEAIVAQGGIVGEYDRLEQYPDDIATIVTNIKEQTITSGNAIKFISNGDNLIECSLKGNMSQSSTPTPTTPIQPSECGELSSNIMPSAPAQTVSDHSVTCVCDGKGTYTLNGTATGGAAEILIDIPQFTVPETGNLAYNFFNTENNANNRLYFYYVNSQVEYYGLYPYNRNGTSLDRANGKTINKIGFRIPEGTTVSMTVSPMIVKGTTIPTTFEPYGYKIPITSNSTTTPVYLGEVETTRNVKKLVLTGDVDEPVRWIGSDAPYAYYYEPTIPIGKSRDGVICSHVPFEWYYQGENPCILMDANFAKFYINLGKDTMDAQVSGNTVAGFKEYCKAQYDNGNPVTIYYILGTATTGILNEPIRKIGDYADTINIPNITTIQGLNTLTVDTTLNPSEIYIKYKYEEYIPKLNTKTITADGTYNASTDNLDGYSTVIVNYDTSSINNVLESVNGSLEDSIGSNI